MIKRERERESRPRLLDLFCGGGGASMGYRMAGWEVTGVDFDPQPNYPFKFIRADALTVPLDGYDAIVLSPPCQGYSRMAHRSGRAYPMLIKPMRERLLTEMPGTPYVIENVEDALPDLIDPVMFCGSSFGLRVRRHRLFETNFELFGPGCDHSWQDDYKPYRLYTGKSRTNGLGYRESGIQQVYGGNHNVGGRSHFLKSVAMGIDWMTETELNESIPPAYTRMIGRQLRELMK
jgi:DNA (cytosine-5)-methyltransferase 1